VVSLPDSRGPYRGVALMWQRDDMENITSEAIDRARGLAIVLLPISTPV